jgi:hypothetical protein
VGVLGVAFQQSERLVSRQLTAGHQDSLGESDAMPCRYRSVQVVAFCNDSEGQTGVMRECLG